MLMIYIEKFENMISRAQHVFILFFIGKFRKDSNVSFFCYSGQCPAAICLDLEHEGASLRHNQQGSRTVCSQPIPDN